MEERQIRDSATSSDVTITVLLRQISFEKSYMDFYNYNHVITNLMFFLSSFYSLMVI